MNLSTQFAQKSLFKLFSQLRHGHLELLCDQQTYRFGQPGDSLSATIRVHNPRFFSRILFGGADAAGDAYVDGDWSSPDPVAVARLAVRNLSGLDAAHPILTFASRLLHRLRHRANRNSIDGSRRNISAHYDLSNDFFRLFLDRSMVYSSAIFEHAAATLEQAQLEKLDRICRKLQLGPQDHLLEIGTGWGAFALHAARNYGCRVTTTTISRQQYEQARESFAAAGEAGTRIHLLLEDYRNLKGSFTKLASIEMFEAVGLEFYDTFFSACDRLLAPGGSLALQTITMNEHRFDEYKKGSDWIQKRIFPGGQLASIREVLASLVRSTRLSIFHMEDIGMHYAETLAEWRRRFHRSIRDVHALGFDEPFCRTWDYYLASCEGAFRERHVSAAQFLLTKNANQSNLFGEPWQESHRLAAVGAGR